MTDIFIAYSSKDLLRVKPLADALRGCGWSVWWAEDTRIGAKIDEAIRRQLDAARAVVAVISRNSVESDWFFAETETARGRDVLFPILLDEMELPTQVLRYRVGRFHNWSERPTSPEFRKLAADIAEKVGTPQGVQSDATAEFKAHDFDADLDDLQIRDEDDEDDPTREEPKRSSFVDPTIDFPVSHGAPAYSLNAAEIERWSGQLISRRLIAVQSPDDAITAAAVDSLLARDELQDYEARLLSFGVANQRRTDLFLENLIRYDLGRRNRATVLVVDSHGALPFIQSALGGPHQAKAMETELRWRDLLIVIQIASRYRRDLQQQFNRFHFPCYNVDFLEPLLRHHFEDSEASSLLATLNKQRAARLWPEDDLDFYDAVQALLVRGGGQLREELEKRAERGQDDLQTGSQPALDAFRSGQPYDKGILFCAAYFPSLDVNEFRRLCLAITGDAEVHVADSSRSLSGEPRKTSRRSTLRDEWPAVADDIFERNGLTTRSKHGIRSVAFERPESRRDLAEFIETRANFFTDAATRLWEEGFLFQPESSSQLVDGMTSLFVATVRHDRSLSRPTWLSEMLIAQLSDGGPKNLEDFVKDWVIDSLILDRTSRLLRALLSTTDRQRLVERWLADVLSRKGHSQALALARHLRYTESFDFFFWLKRFCDESPEAVRFASYSALYESARQSGTQIWELFSKLEDWLPDPTESRSASLPVSGHFALRLIVEYSLDTANELKRADIGSWPARYPLFRDLALDSDSAEQRLSLLVFWLFHPAVASLFRGDAEAAAWAARGRLLSLWSYILLGLDPEFRHPDAAATYHRILRATWQRTDAAGRSRLLRVWQEEIKAYEIESGRGGGKRYQHFTKRCKLVESVIVDLGRAGSGADVA